MPPLQEPPGTRGASQPGSGRSPTMCPVTVNLEYTHLGASIRAGGEVAFFPPVTGG